MGERGQQKKFRTLRVLFLLLPPPPPPTQNDRLDPCLGQLDKFWVFVALHEKKMYLNRKAPTYSGYGPAFARKQMTFDLSAKHVCFQFLKRSPVKSYFCDLGHVCMWPSKRIPFLQGFSMLPFSIPRVAPRGILLPVWLVKRGMLHPPN